MVTANASGDGPPATPRKRPLETGPTEKQEAGQPNSKRSRVSRACDQCRASREKCDGAQPTCQTCVLQQRPCTYHEQPKKRGIQPNYIRTLELTLAWILDSFPDATRHLSTQLPVRDGQVTKLIAGKDSSGSESLHQSWRNGIISRQIEQLLSGGTVEVPTGNDLTQSRTRDSEVVPLDEGMEPYASSAPPPPLPSQSVASTRQDDRSLLKLPDNAWRLLEYYFAFTHSWLPMTDKSAVLKLMYAYPANGMSLDKGVSGQYAELWSILALAAAQLSFHDHDMYNAALIRDTARSLMPSEHGALELGYIKALLLLGLIDLLHARWLPAWLLVGTAVRLITFTRAASARFSRSRSTSAPTPPFPQSSATEDQYHIVGLAAYVLESAIATELQAPTHMRAEHVDAMGLVNEDRLEEWQPWHDPLADSSSGREPARSFSTFNQLVRNAAKPQSFAKSRGNLVALLTQNAARPHPEDRLLPNTLVEKFVRNTHASNDTPMSLQLPARNDNLAFVSVPEGPGSSSVSGEQATTLRKPSHQLPDLWSTEVDVLPAMDDHAPGADIFEELAMLEGNDLQPQPDFLRNLGFSADLDLAEFFGADYQRSDPFLAYMGNGNSVQTVDGL